MSFSSPDYGEGQGRRSLGGPSDIHYETFFHTEILCGATRASKPRGPEGQHVGVPEYQQTAALWTRGILQHEFGVQPKDMEFWMERTPSHSHRGATGFVPPPGVTIHQIRRRKTLAR